MQNLKRGRKMSCNEIGYERQCRQKDRLSAKFEWRKPHAHLFPLSFTIFIGLFQRRLGKISRSHDVHSMLVDFMTSVLMSKVKKDGKKRRKKFASFVATGRVKVFEGSEWASDEEQFVRVASKAANINHILVSFWTYLLIRHMHRDVEWSFVYSQITWLAVGHLWDYWRRFFGPPKILLCI